MEDESSAQPSPPLGRKAAGGAFYIGVSQAARVLLSVATTIVVARILSPADYGVVAMWAPVFAFVLLFQDFGFSTAAVQAKVLTAEQSSTLFWINVLASLVIALVLIVIAQFVGTFFGDPRVGYLTAASAGLVLVGGMAIQHAALLNRDMRFRTMAMITVATAVVSAAATIAFALYFRSYWALFFGNLVSTAIQTVLTWMVCKWRPVRRASLHGARKLIEFGGHIALFNIVNYLARNADNILIGKVWGASALGLYDRSYKLVARPLQLVNAPLSRVMLPVLSRLRDEPERFRKAYLFSAQAILLATAPAAAIAAAESDTLVLVLLGEKWSAAAPVFFWLALVVLYQPAASSTGWLFISCGRGRAYARWGIYSSIVTVASFVIGLPWGPVGVAKAYFLVNFFLVTLPLMVFSTHASPVKALDLFRLPLATFIGCAISWLLVRSADDQFSPLALVVLFIPVSYLIALVSIWVSPHGRTFLSELIGMMRKGQPPFAPQLPATESGD